MDREAFGRRQVEMTARWYEGVKRREGDVEAYIEKRQAAYLDRWREAGRFIVSGSKVLDIGGGTLFRDLLEYLKAKAIDYYYLDVDERAVSSSRDLAATVGFDPGKFTAGFNDQLSFGSSAFDCVFSSHCLEHSISIAKTLSEINRILKPNGLLLMAVPLGWEENPEHPYFFGPHHWIALVEDVGFEIRVAQIGREYPESGYDLFMAARKVALGRGGPRFDVEDFRKESYEFLAYDHAGISYSGNKALVQEGNAAHLKGSDWSIEITLPRPSSTVLPVFLKHPWSAVVQMLSPFWPSTTHDLYSWFSYVEPCWHTGRGRAGSTNEVIVRQMNKNSLSWATEGVLYGVLYK